LRGRQSRGCLDLEKYESVVSRLDNEVELSYFVQPYRCLPLLEIRDLQTGYCNDLHKTVFVREARECGCGSPWGNLCELLKPWGNLSLGTW
jgi:hypothetical protein